MAGETEAAYLLRSGQLYLRRVGLRPTQGGDQLVFAGVKHGALSLYFDEDPHLHCDLEGRWQRVFRDGTHYRKGLDGRVMALDRSRQGDSLVLDRHWLLPAQVDELDDWVRLLALQLKQRVESHGFVPVRPPGDAGRLVPEELAVYLDLIGRWDAALWREDQRLFRDVYHPLPFIPPGMPPAVVLQATLGESGGRSFRGGPAEALRLRSTPCFHDHAHSVKDLLGRRLAQCRTIYLAGPDAAIQPLDVLLGWVSTARQVLPWSNPADRPGRRSTLKVDDTQLDGFHLFLDDFPPSLADVERWRRLKSEGLRQVHVGIASGCPPIREYHQVRWSNESLTRFVTALKRAGLRLSLNLLVIAAFDAGEAERHAIETGQLVEILPLERGDVVSLVDVINPQASLPPHAIDLTRSLMRPNVAPILAQRQIKLTEPHDWIEMI